MQRTETADWAGMRGEDTRADFEAFFCLHQASVLHLALAITGEREAACDVAQEAFLKVLDRWPRVREMESPEGFLRRIAVRTALDSLRSQRRESVSPAASPSTLPEDIAVRHVLSMLKPDHQVFLALSIGEGWSYSEIAQALQLPEGTVASRIHAAKEAFRREWGMDQ